MITIQRSRLIAMLIILAAVAALIALLGWVVGGPAHKFLVVSNVALGVAVLSLIGYVALQPAVVRAFFGQRQVSYGLLTAVTVIIFLGVLVLVNALVGEVNQRWDLTENQDLTLSPQTEQVVSNLPTGVTAIGFYSQNMASSQKTSQDLLNQYRNLNPSKFRYKFIDPYTDPASVSQYNITQDGSIVLVTDDGKHRQSVSSADEQTLTTGLLKLTQAKQPVVYFLSGHGERRIDDTSDPGLSTVKSGLDSDGFQVKPLNLLVTDTVPSDAAVLVVAGPTQSISDAEVKRITTYMDKGGSALLMVQPDSLDPSQDKRPDWGGPLADYLSKTWGVKLRHDYVLDLASSLRGAPDVPVVLNYGSSPVADKLQGQFSLYPASRSISVTNPSGVTISPIAQTSGPNPGGQAVSWGETDFPSLLQGNPQPNSGKDAAGPLDLAVSAERSVDSAGSKQSRLVVFGSVEFASNRWVKTGPVNQDVFLNSVNWLAQQENQITIRQKQAVERKIVPPTGDISRLVGLLSQFGLPLAVVIGGLAVWQRRRSQR